MTTSPTAKLPAGRVAAKYLLLPAACWKRTGATVQPASPCRRWSRALPSCSWLAELPSPWYWLPKVSVIAVPGTTGPTGSRIPPCPRGSPVAGRCQALPRFAMPDQSSGPDRSERAGGEGLQRRDRRREGVEAALGGHEAPELRQLLGDAAGEVERDRAVDPDDRIGPVAVGGEARVVDPELLQELELVGDAGLVAGEHQPAGPVDPVPAPGGGIERRTERDAAPQDAPAVGRLLPHRGRGRLARIDLADVREARAALAVGVAVELEVVVAGAFTAAAGVAIRCGVDRRAAAPAAHEASGQRVRRQPGLCLRGQLFVHPLDLGPPAGHVLRQPADHQEAAVGHPVGNLPDGALLVWVAEHELPGRDQVRAGLAGHLLGVGRIGWIEAADARLGDAVLEAEVLLAAVRAGQRRAVLLEDHQDAVPRGAVALALQFDGEVVRPVGGHRQHGVDLLIGPAEEPALRSGGAGVPELLGMRGRPLQEGTDSGVDAVGAQLAHGLRREQVQAGWGRARAGPDGDQPLGIAPA